jgi:hypothetical protein
MRRNRTMKIKTTYSVKDYEKLSYDTLHEGDKIKMNFELPGKEGLYPTVKCEKESATLIQKKDGNLLFVMDRVIFNSALDTKECNVYAETELARYLENEVKEALNIALRVIGKIIEVRLLSVGEVCEASDFSGFANCEDKQLKYFKKGNHRIAFNKDENYPLWWWLSTPVCLDTVNFCDCNYAGAANYTLVENDNGGVRFAILISERD